MINLQVTNLRVPHHAVKADGGLHPRHHHRHPFLDCTKMEVYALRVAG
jgi:hypothetical protein